MYLVCTETPILNMLVLTSRPNVRNVWVNICSSFAEQRSVLEATKCANKSSTLTWKPHQKHRVPVATTEQKGPHTKVNRSVRTGVHWK